MSVCDYERIAARTVDEFIAQDVVAARFLYGMISAVLVLNTAIAVMFFALLFWLYRRNRGQYKPVSTTADEKKSLGRTELRTYRTTE